MENGESHLQPLLLCLLLESPCLDEVKGLPRAPLRSLCSLLSQSSVKKAASAQACFTIQDYEERGFRIALGLSTLSSSSKEG